VEERRFSAASSIQEATGLQPLWTSFARTLVRQTNKTLVIPNRAEGPVRNLLSADATRTGVPHVSRPLRDVGFHGPSL